mmetsp:Transcript_22249/g.56171  ORF Transcript_22249/g.56171 Transcript_22249/m.56171 type:complete len:140 (+) Transcript_22249:159-578(+)
MQAQFLSPRGRGASEGKKSPSPQRHRYRGQRGADTGTTNRMTCWHEPSTNASSGSPRFPLRSLMLSHKNYTRELQSMPKFLRENADYTDTQEIESQAKPLQLAQSLLYRKTVSPGCDVEADNRSLPVPQRHRRNRRKHC